jgi:hypothetical protein
LAEEAPKNTDGGPGVPVFKFDEGFDRAKYNSQLNAMITPTGEVTGNEIDDDLKKKKTSVESIEKEAIKFYNDNYDSSIKKIDPSLDRASVFYTEAETNIYRDQKEIKKTIESGKSVDGKEIIEMAYNSAENKIKNAGILKNGTVTQIAEKLGLQRIKDSENYNDVIEDFNKKVKDEKLSFDNIINNLWTKFDALNSDEKNTQIKYNTEDNALISALAKILEGEGFKGESVTAMSARYDENISKLSESSKFSIENKSIESKKFENKYETSKLENKEEELSEKKESNEKESSESKQSIESSNEKNNISPEISIEQKLETKGPSIESASSIAENTNNNKSNIESPVIKNTTETKETLKSVSNNSTTITENRPLSVYKSSTVINNKETVKSVSTPEAEKRQESMMESLFEIKPKGSEKPSEEYPGLNKKQDELIESIFGVKSPNKKESDKSTPINSTGKKLSESLDVKLNSKIDSNKISGDLKSNKNEKSEINSNATKLEEKVSNNSKNNETSSISTPIKETITQNLSSVSTIPSNENKEETNKETPIQDKMESNTEKIEGKNTEENKITTQENNIIKENSKNKEVDEEKGLKEKEMQDDIKMMVSLLSQLNNTLQNPLIVISNEKKFT